MITDALFHAQAIIEATTGWKLVTGTLSTSTWTGPSYPNATGVAPGNFNQTCTPSCLCVACVCSAAP